MKAHRFSRFFQCSLTAALLLLALPRAASAQALHVRWAEDLVIHVAPALNTYGGDPGYVYWAGVRGASEYANRSLCTTFLSMVLKQTYGWTDADFVAWFGTKSPNATRYHDTIVAQNGFVRIYNVLDIESGDILMIRYYDRTDVSGHGATARGPAVLRAPTAPIVPNTLQFEIPVVDSSASGHGPTDTRQLPSGGFRSGAGFGVMRLYTDPRGIVVGYTWSTYATSIYYDQSVRHLAIGRLDLE